MNLLLSICARGGSKGIPGKNIKPILGKPLIYYSLKVAEAFSEKHGADIFISTDSEEIKKVVNELHFKGVDTSYNRPAILSTDAAGKLDVIKEIRSYAESVNKKKYDYVIDLDVTSPLRTVGDISDALTALMKNGEAINSFSVSPAHRNPYFNMVEECENGFYSLCKKGAFLTRQSAPKVYDLNASFYIFKSAFFDSLENNTVISDRTIVYEVPHQCFDLDHPIDFEFMSFLLENDKLDFNMLK